MVVDAHAHIGKFLSVGGDVTFEQAITQADRMGVDKLFCTHILALYYYFDEGNQEVYQAMQCYPERILGWVSICSPRHGQKLLDHIDRCVLEWGFHGLKIYSHPSFVFGSAPLIDITDRYMWPIFARAEAWNVPVLAHTNARESDIVCTNFPNLKLIMAHMGATPISQGDWHTAIRTAERHPNLYLDCTTSCADFGMVEETVRVLGPERLVWGTDIPLIDPWVGLDKVRGAEIDDRARAMILGDNIMSLVQEGQKTIGKGGNGYAGSPLAQ